MYDDYAATQNYVKPRVPSFSQAAFTATQPVESSSDQQLGPSSSPALKASQRRAEHQHQVTQPPSFQQVSRHVEYGASEDYATPPSQKALAPRRASPRLMELSHAPPVVQGIHLVPTNELPDRLRTVFPFPMFNAVQSKCFNKVYKSDNNFVLASPTGSGKTAILELAICRAIVSGASGQYKIVYQAPTKALCSERSRDWQKKFNPLGLQCAELTGDSDGTDLSNVKTADIIITTPEKWDSVTRKWQDHAKLMKLVKLFLIDEVHILKEDRGATLETVVSRMKTIGTDVRFVALSATVPNFEDVAKWLGKGAAEPYEPANNEKFGEEFRPVKLKKHVYGYNFNTSNDFAFDKFLDSKLPELIVKHSERKPIMVFCLTRNATVSTAKMLSGWWASRSPRDRYWSAPSKVFQFQDRTLRECAASGVAFHHAGLETHDRLGVENGYLHGEIKVICCTSTLAVGVNLPCHFVIIKNTVAFSNAGLQEYADLEIMQMLGRAGRPQFDDTAVAVIMTRQTKARRYELMVTGQDLLESRLHLNLIDHLNAEISLGTISDLTSAKRWLAGTFLYVRLKNNPEYYKLEGSKSGQSVDEQLDDICEREITLLQANSLVTTDAKFRCTDYGYAMARYCLHFETMQVIIGLQPKASLSEILSALAQAAEFRDMRLRVAEKAFYKSLNNSPSIRFPIPVTLNTPAHKVSIIMQAVIGGTEPVWDNEMGKHKTQYGIEEAMVFKHANRLIRCVIDCQLCTGDSIAVRNAMMLERSIGAKVWDDSPLQIKQVPSLGIAAVRKFVNASIKTVEELESTEPHRIEVILGRNPPFGHQVLDRLKGFPKLRVSITSQPNSTKQTKDGVQIQVKADIGFLNEKPPTNFARKLVFVCLLVETSDGRTVHFARISGSQLGQGRDLVISALLTNADQSINCYVMCESIAGTMRWASVKPKIAPSMFPPAKPRPRSASSTDILERPTSNMSKRRSDNAAPGRRASGTSDEFGDDGINDDELMKATVGDLDFDHIENYANPTESITRKNTAQNKASKEKVKPQAKPSGDYNHEPRQLENGKWACNHRCKDKQACKHMCCRDGLDKPPKKITRKGSLKDQPASQSEPSTLPQKEKTQSKLLLASSKRKQGSGKIEVLDLTQQEKKRKNEYALSGPVDYRNLHQLHKNIQKKDPPPSISSVMHKKPAYCYAEGGEPSLSFLDKNLSPVKAGMETSDYGDIQLEDLSSHFDHAESVPTRAQANKELANFDFDELLEGDDGAVQKPPTGRSDAYGDDDSMLDDALIGLADSQALMTQRDVEDEDMATYHDGLDNEPVNDYQPDGFGLHMESVTPRTDPVSQTDFGTSSTIKLPTLAPEKGRSLFLNDAGKSQSRPQKEYDGFKPAKSMLKSPELEEMRQVKAAPQRRRTRSSEKAMQHSQDENDPMNLVNDQDTDTANAVVPDAYKDLEPWLFAEFGDIVELVSG
ncbi:Sec63 Brl domain-containing protein [Lophiotrema nucula]|uniref:DNA 3'-5' helicase n=1 Tax=Lophiotrema nucula TaxID=690887 RepID=A0A6A5YWU1_9PLEO|nr:Sec63 Brl domain-containing protein [Lophiotrema nucula]